AELHHLRPQDRALSLHCKTPLRGEGEGCWSSVPKLAGLQRCGKRCRLRWINYLRPDRKRGSFSQQEGCLTPRMKQFKRG
ncbi:unnamed protein product, partial [Musa banksii]